MKDPSLNKRKEKKNDKHAEKKSTEVDKQTVKKKIKNKNIYNKKKKMQNE